MMMMMMMMSRVARIRPPDLLRAAACPAPHQHHIPASRQEKWKNVSLIKIIDLIKMPRSWNTTEHQLNQLKFLNVERYISYFIYLTMPNAQTIVIFGSSKSSSLLNLHVSPAVPLSSPSLAASVTACLGSLNPVFYDFLWSDWDNWHATTSSKENNTIYKCLSESVFQPKVFFTLSVRVIGRIVWSINKYLNIFI